MIEIHKKINPFFLLIIVVFIIRVFPINFPSFTADEARIAFRGYTLATTGRDELGRSWPLLFNSLDDYELPVVSYLAAAGELIFGKNEFGVRIPFILIGLALVLLTYKIAKLLNPKLFFQVTAAMIVAFSPALIFLSKIPNEAVVLTFVFALLFYLLISHKNLFLIMMTMIISIFTSKLAWFILIPFLFFTVKQRKLILLTFGIAIVFAVLVFFLMIPQAKRSLAENNLSIFSSVTISNGINKLRGQGIQSGWPNYLERALFNKLDFFMVGFLHWLSQLSPVTIFGRFDELGRLNFSSIGAFTKVLLIPFIAGLFFLIKKGDRKNQAIIFLWLVLTFPAMFVYPSLSLELVVITLPFMALVIALGMQNFSKIMIGLIVILVAIELILNLIDLSPQKKMTTFLRPGWVKDLSLDISRELKTNKIALSDNINSDIVPLFEWYAPVIASVGFQPIPWPYKFRQYQLGDIKIIGSQESFTTCGINEKVEIFVSKRDLQKIEVIQSNPKISKIYQDDNGEDRVYLIDNICIR